MKADRSRASAIAVDSKVIRLILAASAIGLVLLSILVIMHAGARGADASVAANASYQARENYTYSVGLQAYIYGIAPVIMEKTEYQMVTTPGRGHAPVNRMGYSTGLATPDDTIIVTPNADTLYNSAWLELSKEPIVLHVPDTGGRYYIQQLLDAYTNTFGSVGRRTTGTAEGNFAIVGPGWRGTLPAGVQEIRAPTNTTWIIGRILVNGPQDLPAVVELQKQFTLTPLSQFDRPGGSRTNQTLADFGKATPSPGARPELAFYEQLRVALKNNPPPAGEAALMATFAQVGLLANESPYGTSMDPAVAAGLARALKDGDQIVTMAFASPEGKKNINGWTYMTDIGTYGYDYLTRAAVAVGGLGANLPQDAVYPKAQVDSDGRPLSGANNYTMHFARDNLPPVDAFWSVTVYNATTYMLVPNPVDRYNIGDRTQGLKYNPDGSLDIYIRQAPPAGNESNWLPAPGGEFYLILRMYQPRQPVIDGTYRIPSVNRV